MRDPGNEVGRVGPDAYELSSYEQGMNGGMQMSVLVLFTNGFVYATLFI